MFQPLFLKNLILPILAKNCPKLAIWLDYPTGIAGNPGKNPKVGGFETEFKPVPFVFHRTTCTYSESWGPVENLCDPPNPQGGGGTVGKKNDRKTKNMTEKNSCVKNFFH